MDPVDPAVELAAAREPLPGEPYGGGQLNVLARELAQRLEVNAQAASRWKIFQTDLERAESALERAYTVATQHSLSGEPLEPIEEWLLDNRHIVDEQFRDVR